jgi:hypothetical protein
VDSGACRSCELIAVVESGEAVRAGLDGVPGLVQGWRMSRMRLLTVSGRTPKQGGDGDLWQGQAVVQDGGQEPVGQGEDGAAVSPGGYTRSPRTGTGLHCDG